MFTFLCSSQIRHERPFHVLADLLRANVLNRRGTSGPVPRPQRWVLRAVLGELTVLCVAAKSYQPAGVLVCCVVVLVLHLCLL